MKQPFFIGILTLFSCISLNAQNDYFQNNVNLHYGISTFSLFSGKINPYSSDSLQHLGGAFSHVPTIGFAWDYATLKWFSVGFAGSYNNVKLRVDAVNFDKNPIGEVTISIPRTTFAARFLFHYGNSNYFDCYSGIRLGIGIWSPKINAEISPGVAEAVIQSVIGSNFRFGSGIIDKLPSKVTFVATQFQVIPIGVRWFFTDHLGVNAELAVGSPYFLSAGANYRF
ncbi:MAG: outer membrane beta-barrel protein [Saprospiraceae bacterium]